MVSAIQANNKHAQNINRLKMKYLFSTAIVCYFLAFNPGCHTTRHINKAIAGKDSSLVPIFTPSSADSVKMINATLDEVRRHHIDFRSFDPEDGQMLEVDSHQAAGLIRRHV